MQLASSRKVCVPKEHVHAAPRRICVRNRIRNSTSSSARNDSGSLEDKPGSEEDCSSSSAKIKSAAGAMVAVAGGTFTVLQALDMHLRTQEAQRQTAIMQQDVDSIDVAAVVSTASAVKNKEVSRQAGASLLTDHGVSSQVVNNLNPEIAKGVADEAGVVEITHKTNLLKFLRKPFTRSNLTVASISSNAARVPRKIADDWWFGPYMILLAGSLIVLQVLMWRLVYEESQKKYQKRNRK